MKKFSKLFLTAIIWIFFLWNISWVYAWDIWLIPSEKVEWTTCGWLFEAFWTSDRSTAGEFDFDMIWCYIVYLIDIFSKIAVMISFVFVLVWAFRYTITYLEWDDDWKKAKETIKNALIWLAVSTLAYVIVDVFIRFLL